MGEFRHFETSTRFPGTLRWKTAGAMSVTVDEKGLFSARNQRSPAPRATRAASGSRRDGAGSILVDSRMGGEPAEGGAVWSAPLPPHTLENVGESELRVISVELKGPGAAGG